MIIFPEFQSQRYKRSGHERGSETDERGDRRGEKELQKKKPKV